MENEAYIIDYKALAYGKYDFSYLLDESFFAIFPQSEVSNSKVDVKVQMLNYQYGLEFTFGLSGWVEVICDRCGDLFHQPIKGNYKLKVKFGEQNESIADTDEEIVIEQHEKEIDISQFLYEYVLLSIPVRRVHKSIDLCNKDAIEMLKQMENRGQAQTKAIDSRWDKLKDLYN